MRLAIPSKGRLHEPTTNLLERAGLQIRDGSDRKLYAKTVDDEITVLYARASDIPEYVHDGAADLGITGLDQVREAEVELETLLDLEYGNCRLVVASPEDDEINSVEQLEGKKIATEFPNITRRYFAEKGVNVNIVRVSGSTELTPNVGMSDAIVDITSTGTTLEVNHLKVVDEVLKSSCHLFTRPELMGDPKVNEIKNALKSVIDAEGKRYLMMNASEKDLKGIKEVMPGLGGPTVMRVEGNDDLVAVHAVVDESDIYETINKVKEKGARDILVVPIERMMR
ncbi:MAG: ATP phosphoribosyltransferase [Halobacteria archaeon]|nr:ATP phosphoribosyltransferase [Halobacteria archaeon]